MFTGIIERVGSFVRRETSGANGKLAIRPVLPFDSPLVHGESIAVNGCCLTLEKVAPDGTITFHTLAETLRCTNLGSLSASASVNMERALKLGDRLGGHIVSGHVDGTGVVRAARMADSDYELEIRLSSALSPEVILKGSIAVNGVSLTVQSLTHDTFTVRLIPTTLGDTNLEFCKAGSIVNLETDLLGKYVRHQLTENREPSGTITMDKLRSAGFF